MTRMFRIVFQSVCPRSRKLILEYGPWHPKRKVVQEWLAYFESVRHPAGMLIESMARRKTGY